MVTVSFRTRSDTDDFSKGVRGGFVRRGARLCLPIYLDPKAEAFLRKLADQRGTEVGQIVNEWIRKDIEPDQVSAVVGAAPQ